MQIKPLTGIKVIDLSKLLPGPMCTLHLADMGAEVIKIEDPGKGDPSRYVPPIQKSNSSFFLAVNRNKFSMTLDLTKEEGKNIFLKLARSSDVLVEGFRPGVVDKLGINYEKIKMENPKIVYCSISGYGQTGPYKNKSGHDLNFSSYAGILNASTKVREKPQIPNFQIADIVGGTQNAVIGILAAIIHQKNTGQGQHVDVSILDGTLAHCACLLGDLNVPENETSSSDVLTGATPFYNTYETADKRFISIAAVEFKFWQRFCEALGRSDLIQCHNLNKTTDESKKVYKELTDIFKTRILSEWVDHFKDVDCCFSPVLTFEEVINNEQIKARNMVITEDHPKEGKVAQFNLPIKFSNFELKVEKDAPMLGEDTEKILVSLGFSENEINELKARKVV